jgi:hypothetical protein
VVQLRDAATATALMEARQSLALKEHAEWLVEYEKVIVASRQEAEASRREFDRRMKDLDKRIADLVSAFGAWISKKN